MVELDGFGMAGMELVRDGEPRGRREVLQGRGIGILGAVPREAVGGGGGRVVDGGSRDGASDKLENKRAGTDNIL